MNMTPTPAQRNGIRSSAEAVSVADSIDSLKSSRASEASEPASLMRSRAVSEDARRRRGEFVGEGIAVDAEPGRVSDESWQQTEFVMKAFIENFGDSV